MDLPAVAKTQSSIGVPTYFENLTPFNGLQAAKPQDRSINVSYENLPADTVFTIVGAMQTGVGFVPLGLGIQMDSDKNGRIDSIEAMPIRYAAQHSGLAGFPYYVISAATNAEELLDGDDIRLSGFVHRFESIPVDGLYLDSPDFTDFVTCMNYDATDGLAFTADAHPDATFVRTTFTADFPTKGFRKYWSVYAPPGAENEIIAVQLPLELSDLEYEISGTPWITAATLNDKNGDSVSYDHLFEFNAYASTTSTPRFRPSHFPNYRKKL